MPKKWMQYKDEMEKVLIEADTGFMGMIQNDRPYVIPMSFAYKEDKIYLHSSLKGLKLDCIRNNPLVCFTVSEQQLVPNINPCEYSVRYRSVIARGKARIIDDVDEKLGALNTLAAKYARGNDFSPLDSQKVQITAVIEICVEELTGKYNLAE